MLLGTENLNLKGRGEAGQALKWRHHWVGPFEVIKQQGTTVELKLPHAWSELHPRFHVELLRPYHSTPGRYDEPPPELDTEGAQIYEVEKILNHRWNGRKKRFEWRIKWKGYPDATNTWEPLENLVGASEFPKEYGKAPEMEQQPRRGKVRTYGIMWFDDIMEQIDQCIKLVFNEDQGKNAGCKRTDGSTNSDHVTQIA